MAKIVDARLIRARGRLTLEDLQDETRRLYDEITARNKASRASDSALKAMRKHRYPTATTSRLGLPRPASSYRPL
jgi:hypothetical protein